MQTAAARFPEALKLRVPQGMAAALATAARRRHTSASEWARQCLLERLAAEGVRLGDDGQVEASAEGRPT
jgi:hypothetical protein